MREFELFDDLDNTVFDIIDVADKEGFAHFVCPKAYLPRDVSIKSKAGLHRLLEQALHDHHLFTSSSKTWPAVIAAAHQELANGGWLVRFDAAKFFCLPAVNPAEELAELRGLFEVMKRYYEQNAQGKRPAVIRVMNERDHHGRVYGSLKCLLVDAGPIGSRRSTEFETELQGRIDASATLQHFQRHYALALGKIGRFSWCDLREDSFFQADKRPWTQAFYAREDAKKNEASAIA